MFKPLNLLAGIRNLGKPGKADKFSISIKVEGDGVLFDPDDKPLARATAAAITETIKNNLMAGKNPAGQPMPPLKASTLKHRAIEAAQGQRGGAADPRYKDPDFRATAQANYDRDYTAAKAGKFTPVDGKPRGNVSGMLAESIFTRPNKDGRGVTVNVAAKRGRARPSKTDRKPEAKSALESVFGDAPIWDGKAQEQPAIREALQRTADAMIGKSVAELQKAALDLLNAMRETFEKLEDFSDE